MSSQAPQQPPVHTGLGSVRVDVSLIKETPPQARSPYRAFFRPDISPSSLFTYQPLKAPYV